MRLLAKQRVWLTSDGQQWSVWAEANRHEKFITLRARIRQLMKQAHTEDTLTQALLDTPGLTFFALPLDSKEANK